MVPCILKSFASAVTAFEQYSGATHQKQLLYCQIIFGYVVVIVFFVVEPDVVVAPCSVLLRVLDTHILTSFPTSTERTAERKSTSFLESLYRLYEAQGW